MNSSGFLRFVKINLTVAIQLNIYRVLAKIAKTFIFVFLGKEWFVMGAKEIVLLILSTGVVATMIGIVILIKIILVGNWLKNDDNR